MCGDHAGCTTPMASVTPTCSNSTPMARRSRKGVVRLAVQREGKGRVPVQVLCMPTSTVSVVASLEREGEEPFVATLRAHRRRLHHDVCLLSMVRHSSLFVPGFSSNGRPSALAAGAEDGSHGEFRRRRFGPSGYPRWWSRLLARWLAMAPPSPAPLRAALARLALRRAAWQAGIWVAAYPDGHSWDRLQGPVLKVADANAFFAQAWAGEGKIGFGEAYVAGNWDAPLPGRRARGSGSADRQLDPTEDPVGPTAL